MKSYTDLEQSKKLSEFLPIESADFFWLIGRLHTDGPRYQVIRTRNEVSEPETCWPCWSLAALFSILPIIGKDKDTANPFIAKTPTGEYYVVYATLYKEIDSSGIYNNPIDACVEMILKLKEKNLL